LSAAESGPDLTAVHDRLRVILTPYRERLHVAVDGPGGLTLEFPGYAGMPWGFAAATRLGKRYVSFYLMGVYGQPTLIDGMSPELRRRMQGKSCFNFTKLDEALFEELEVLTERSIAAQPAMIEAALAAKPRR
jgi:hypothetical protein